MSPSEYAQLVEFLGERFAAIDRRFTAIDQRFTSIDQGFASIDQGFASIDQGFVSIDQRFASIDQRFADLERRLDDLRAEILGHFDELYRRLERLEQEYQAIVHGLRRIETMLADERQRRERIEGDLAALRGQVVVLEARIDELERRLRS